MKPNTPGFIGARLKEAREARGMNATTLAEKLGLSKASISKYENDSQSPGPAVMDKICQTLKVPQDFFYFSRKRSIDDVSPIFYRSLSAATKIERLRAERRYIWLQDIFSYLWQYIEFPNANLPGFNLPEDPLKISFEDIEEIANNTRKFWGLGDGPISNMIWLLENNGIVVSCYELEAITLDAFSQFCYDRPHIILGTDKKSAARSRFNAAHELGHLILHRHISSKTFRTPQYFKVIEEQAHYFAAAFHLTRQAFYEEVTYLDLEFLKFLKRRWKLSIALFIKRGKDLGFIDSDESQRLWRSYSRKGWKQHEPLDDEILLEKPQLLKNGFELLIDQQVKSRSEILHDLKLNPKDIEEIAGLEPLFLNDKKAEVIELPLRRVFTTPLTEGKPGEIIRLFK